MLNEFFGCALIRGRCFCEAGLKIATKHVSSSLVTHERFVVPFFLPYCCINSLMSGQNGDLAGLKLHSSVMSTSPPHSHSWTNSQILTFKSCIFVSFSKYNYVHEWKMTQGLVSPPPPSPYILTGQKRDLTRSKISLAGHRVRSPPENYFEPWIVWQTICFLP